MNRCVRIGLNGMIILEWSKIQISAGEYCIVSTFLILFDSFLYFFNFVAFHTVVFGTSIYYGPSNTTLCYQRCLIQQFTGRHVSVSR